MVKIILEIKEEETVIFKNKKKFATGLNVSIVEIGNNASKMEQKASKLIQEKLDIENKLQVYDETKKEKKNIEDYLKNLLRI